MQNSTINNRPTIEIEQLVPYMQSQIVHKQLIDKTRIDKVFKDSFSWVASNANNVQVVLYYQAQFGRIRAEVQLYKNSTMIINSGFNSDNLFVSIPKWDNYPQDKKEILYKDLLDLFEQKLIEVGYTFEKIDGIKEPVRPMYENVIAGRWFGNIR